MTTPTDAMPSSPAGAQAAAPAAPSPTRPLFWSVRRELWENRSIFLAPLAAAAVVLVGWSVSLVHLPEHRRNAMALDPARRAVAIALPYEIAAMVIIITGLIVGVFYCLGALHNERRDRSILFWKSLPVSDLTTVLSKAVVVLIVLPVVIFAVVVAMQLAMLALSTVVLVANGMGWTPSTPLPLFRLWLVLLYGLAVLALWYAPIGGWLLLVGGWARRTPFLWAFLPPMAICVAEKIAFNTSHFASLLTYRLGGFAEALSVKAHGKVMLDPVPGLEPLRFLSTPGLWLGLAFAAACFAAAAWQRRRREPI